MATAFGATTQFNAVKDLDMMSPSSQNDEIDFDIDIEFDAPEAGEDIEVQDAPREPEDLDELTYTDEIMYEGNDDAAGERVEEIEMQENQDDTEIDQQMDDTIYHEAHSELNMEDVEIDVAQINPITNDQRRTSETGTGTDKEPVLKSPELSESVTTTVADDTLNLGQTAEESQAVVAAELSVAITDAPVSATSVTGSELQESAVVVTEGDIVATDAQVEVKALEASEESDEINYDSDVDEVAPYEVRQADEEYTFQQPEELDDGASDVEADSEIQATAGQDVNTSDAATVEQNGEVKEEDSDQGNYEAFAYNALVQYEQHLMALFSPGPGDLPDQFLLPDASLAEGPLSELFGACRIPLADSISSDDDLCIEVADLKITLSECDSDCANVTLSQIIDVYHHLHNNDESYEPQALKLILTVRHKPLIRLTRLFKAAANGKGYAAVLAGDFEDSEEASDETPVNNEENNEEHAEEWIDQNDEEYTEDYPKDQDQDQDQDWNDDEDRGIDAEETAQVGTDNVVEQRVNVSAADLADVQTVAQSHHVSSIDEQDDSASQTVLPNDEKPQSGAIEGEEFPNSGVALAEPHNVDADDLIDYSDDDDEAVQVSRSPTIQPEQSHAAVDDLGHPHPKDVTKVSSDVQIESRLDPKDGSISPRGPSHRDPEPQDAQSTAQSVVQTVNSSSANVDELDGQSAEDYLNLDLDFEHEVLHSVGGKSDDARINHTSQDQGAAAPDESLKPGSPSGKRTWDEHAADSVKTASEHDPKRVRSDG